MGGVGGFEKLIGRKIGSEGGGGFKTRYKIINRLLNTRIEL